MPTRNWNGKIWLKSFTTTIIWNAAFDIMEMHRRDFLILIYRACVLLAGGSLITRRFAANLRDRKSFFVAGVRFCKPTARLMNGDAVKIKPETFQGNLCYGVFNASDERIGYVPRALVASLRQSQIVESYISLVNQHA